LIVKTFKAPRGVCAALVLAGACGLAFGDAIVRTQAMKATTIAEFFVGEASTTVELEIGLQDIEGFRNLTPDAIYERMGYDPEPLEKRLVRFFEQDLTLHAEGGPPVRGRVEEIYARPRVRRDEISGEPLPVAEDDEEIVVFARLVYETPRRPRTLTLSPPRTEAGFPSATIGFVAYHLGLPVNDFRYLGTGEILQLDWSDPWYSRFDNRNLKRQYDAPMSAFLYVEPYEVRKEIVLRPRDLQQWTDLGLDGVDVIPAERQAEIKQRVADFLSGISEVTIDGRTAEGALDRIHFIRRSLRKMGVIDPPEDLDAISATVGVIFVYPTDGLPQEVTMKWELFNERITRVPAAATDEAGGLPSILTPDDPVLVWQNFLTNPTIPGLVEVQTPSRGGAWAYLAVGVVGVIGLLVIGFRHGRGIFRGSRPSWTVATVAVALIAVVAFSIPRAMTASAVSEEDAGAVVTSLLENIYRAFDYRDENVIYDTLERSVSGDLLTRIYLETRRSLEIENQGGARAKVQEIEMLESSHQPLDRGHGFESRSTWTVAGSVGHWGHIHRRTNQYEARVVVEAIDGVWKVTDLELLQEERL
jgi:hypothetical protein